MAKVGAGAGYSQLKRVGNYIAPQINAGADRLAANARQQKQLNATENARVDKQIYDATGDIEVDTEALQSKATGFETRDDLARDFAMTATQRSEEYAELAREAAAKQDWKTMNDYKGKINRIKGDFKNTVNDEEILKEIFQGYQEKYSSGEVDDEEWLDFAESMEKFNYEITLDENDNKVIRAIVLDDEGQPELDENGNPKVIQKKWSEVVQQRDRPYEVVRLEDKEGKKGLIGDMLATMGKRKYDENTGQFIETSQTWDDQAEKQFMAKVKGLQSDNRTMYSLLKQAGGGTKKKDFTDEDYKLVEDFLRFQVKGGYGEETSMKVAPATQEQRESEAAKDRAVTMRGQNIAKDKAAASNELALKRLALDEWKAKNPQAKSLNKTETKELENDTAVVKFFDVAKEMAKLDAGASEEEVQAVLDKSGLGFVLGSDFDFFGLQDTQYDIGSVDGVNQKDVFKNIKGMASAAGLTLKDTDIKESINRIQAGTSKTSDSEAEVSTKPSTEGMTPQEKIEYYKNLNKK